MQINVEFIDRDIPDEVVKYLKKQKEVAIDIETTRKYYKYENEGLDPHVSKIVMFQIGTKERQFVIDTRVVDITPILPILTDHKIMLVGQNIKFEYKHI